MCAHGGTITSVVCRSRRPCRPRRTDNSFWQPQFPDPQLGMVFPRTFLVRAPGSCLSARMAAGASETLLYEDAPYKFAFYYYYYI